MKSSKISSTFNRLLPLLIFAVITSHNRITASNVTDYDALVAIKSEFVEHYKGALRSWNHSRHHCQWVGVTCGRKHNRVTVLDLNSNGLIGNISPYIGNLSFLTVISLYNNSLYGRIPSELGRLSRLQRLSLYNNTLSGNIPANLSSCFNLHVLNIAGNKLEGKLPLNLGSLTKLTFLNVGFNHLSGPFFQVIANITSLETISAPINAFTGNIHDSVASFLNLRVLQMAENDISGLLPTPVFNLSSLQILDFGENQLRGEIPADIGFTLPRLQILFLSMNYFSGSIPNSVTNLTFLEEVELGGNNFTGRIPRDFGHLKNLRTLIFGKNYALQGDINLLITSLVNCTQLQMLEIQDNDVTGILPQSLANLSTTLRKLSTADNPIIGSFPVSITNLINLDTLYMANNNLIGSLPRDFGKLHGLDKLVLRNNKLTGTLPMSLGNLSYLSGVDLGNNNLEGNIPVSMGSCSYLEFLYLENNNLTGTLPNEIFQGSAKFIEIHLAQNHFDGSFPSGIGLQTNLNWLEVSNNELSGVLPDSLGSCVVLQWLFMDGNSFHGSIPLSLSSLTSLQQIDLSRNNFSGLIPAYFSRFPLIDYLNLSYNNFEGRVPTDGVFKNVSVVFLVGNAKLCGGIASLHLPKCIRDSRKDQRRSSHVVRLIVPMVCVSVLVVAFAVAALCLSSARNKRNHAFSDPLMTNRFLKVSYDMLLKATNGFSSENLLGTGTFGSVFKGNLNGQTVAVKVINLQKHGASKSYMAECKALRNIRHRNLVRIITTCSSIDFQGNEFKALVYEFMSNGNLDIMLHGVGNLTILERLNIAIDVGHALMYLHHSHDSPIVHSDLKPSNILLDDDMVARVGDFGLAKFLTHHPAQQNPSSATGFRGTVGYAAPEYGLGSEASPDGDLYSYGILLLEIVTGKRPTDRIFKEDNTLHMYAMAALPDEVFQIVDPSLHIQVDEINDEVIDKRMKEDTVQRRVQCIASMVNVGVACSQHMPQDRLGISDAISELQAARDNLVNAKHITSHYKQDNFHQV